MRSPFELPDGELNMRPAAVHFLQPHSAAQVQAYNRWSVALNSVLKGLVVKKQGRPGCEDGDKDDDKTPVIYAGEGRK